MTVAENKETLGFQTEVKQLLHLMIHSLYSNREIFLRELISNASDAADKLRFEALHNGALYENDPDLRIEVSFDQEQRQVRVRDNGIGMNREDVIAHLGTIAKSGTAQFLESLSGDQKKDSQLIGQFGVGFYSAFIVADKVTVLTRRAGEPVENGVRWESAGEGEFTVEPIERAERGTEIILHLKADAAEFADGFRLRSIIRKYSDHISLPIQMLEESLEADDEEKKEPKFETVNKATALWARSRTEVEDSEYTEFYHHLSHDFSDPLTWSHNKVEGKLEYTSLLYIPAKAPFDLYHREMQRGLKLYVQRVFIMDEAEQFLPSYLRFVKGVVDSNDLSLNVSREILQQDPQVDAMRSALTKRVLDMLGKLAKKEPEQYASFWREFGQVLKEGPAEDYSNREKIADLLRFSTTHTDQPDQDQSLKAYVERMGEGQDKIYYVAAESFNAAKNSPHLEIFRKKGIEVLLLSERVDEWLMSHLRDFDGKPLVDVARGALDLGELDSDEEKAEQEQVAEAKKDLVERISKVLEDQVQEVRVTHRLTDSPACLVVGEYDMGAQMQRILKAAGQEVPESKPIFEINPTHPLLERLDQLADEDRFADLSKVLFDQALLAEGGQLEDPGSYVQRLNKLLLELAG